MIYTFKNNDTGEVFEKVMSMADKDPYLKENPNLSLVITPVAMSYSGTKSTISQASDGFNDILKSIKAGSGKDCTIETK